MWRRFVASFYCIGLCGILTGIIFGTAIAVAQESETSVVADKESSDERTEDVEKIEVTGSRIKRIDLEGPAPVIVIDREEIEASGLNDIASILGNSTAQPFGSNGGSADLRGLGAARTLVLLNGQRLPAGGDTFSPNTRIDTIPLAAVERIEILKDGAASVYGSDALAGVVNIITRKDLDGFVLANKSQTNKYGQGIKRFSLAHGYNSDKLSVLTSIQLDNYPGTTNSDLWHREGVNARHFFNNNYVNDAGKLVAMPGCSQVASNGRCIENVEAMRRSLPTTDYSLVNSVNYEMDGLILSNTILYTHTESKSVDFSSFLYGSNADGSNTFTFTAAETIDSWIIAQSGDWTGGATTLFARMDEIGPGRTHTVTEAAGLVSSVAGQYGATWDWKVTLNNQRTDKKRLDFNHALKTRTKNAILSGQYFPGDPARNNVAGLTEDLTSTSFYQTNAIEATMTGEIAQTSNTTYSAAFGVTALDQKYEDNADPLRVSGETMGYVGVNSKAGRTNLAVFSELGVLIGEKLEILGSIRHDSYNDFGGTTNPRIATRYKAMPKVMIRASAGTGFQAPQLQDVYGPQLPAFFNLVDTPRCNATGAKEACSNALYEGLQGANPKLKEETSKTLAIGVVTEPFDQFSFSVDYYQIVVNNVITSDAQDLLEAISMGADESDVDATIERETPGDVTTPIKKVSLPLANFGKRDLEGLDFTAKYRLRLGSGWFGISMEHGFISKYSQETFNILGANDEVDKYTTPRWRNNFTLSFEKQTSFRLNLTARTTSSTKRRDKNKAKGRIPQYTQYDTSSTFFLSKDAKLQVGAINVFGTIPKLDDSQTTFMNSTLFARNASYYTTFTYQF